MRSSHFSVLILHAWLSGLSSAAAVPELVPRDRPAADCGRWTIYCGGNTNKAATDKQSAAGACNNACYYIQCMQEISLTEGPAGNDGQTKVAQADWQTKYAGGGVDHRMESGCTITNGQAGQVSVCTNFPFSQQWNDLQDIQLASTGQPPGKVPANPANKPVGDDYRSCDEFPMNEMDPVPSKSKAYASLRCMPQKQNQEGGQQLSQYITKGGGQDKNAYPQPRRDMNACPDTDKLVQGDKFKPEFDGVDTKTMPYCEIPKTAADRLRICKTQNDGQQYYMTHREGDKGKADMPYQVGSNNRYAVHEGQNSDNPRELQQCMVVVNRDVNTSKKSDKQFHAEISVTRSTSTGGTNGYKEVGSWKTDDKCPPQPGEFTIKDARMPQDLKVTFPPGGNTNDPIQNPINFAYDGFTWTSKTEGWAVSMNDITQKGVKTTVQGYKADKSFCYGKSKKVNQPEEIETGDGGKTKSQIVTCFFPCFES